MFKSVKDEPKDVKDLLKKILKYHFEPTFSDPPTQNTRKKQVISWIESASKRER